MKWGYSGHTKAETRRLVHSVKEKEELHSYIEEADEIDTLSIKKTKIPKKLRDKEFH